MEPIDRAAPATLGDLHDVRDELRAEMKELFAEQTRALAGEIARAVEVMAEHNESLFRAASDETRAV